MLSFRHAHATHNQETQYLAPLKILLERVGNTTENLRREERVAAEDSKSDALIFTHLGTIPLSLYAQEKLRNVKLATQSEINAAEIEFLRDVEGLFNQDSRFPDIVKIEGTLSFLGELELKASTFIINYINEGFVWCHCNKAVKSWYAFTEAAYYVDSILVGNANIKKGQFIVSVAKALRHWKFYKYTPNETLHEIGDGRYLNGWYHNLKALTVSTYLLLSLKHEHPDSDSESYMSQAEYQQIYNEWNKAKSSTDRHSHILITYASH